MAVQHFRSAFNGFNREDVVHYIEYLNARHTAEVNQLQADSDLLRTQLAAAQQNTGLQEQLTQALNRLEEAQAKIVELEAREPVADSGLTNRCADLEAQLAAALDKAAAAEANAAQHSAQQELEAYRRAERTERVARERAEQVYRLANGALADATARVDEASGQLTGITDKVSAQLAQLQQAVAGSKAALADAAATLYTIRPGSAEE